MYGWVVGVFVLLGVVELDLAVFVGVCTSLVVRPGTAVWSVAGRHAIVCRQDYVNICPRCVVWPVLVCIQAKPVYSLLMTLFCGGGALC